MFWWVLDIDVTRYDIIPNKNTVIIRGIYPVRYKGHAHGSFPLVNYYCYVSADFTQLIKYSIIGTAVTMRLSHPQWFLDHDKTTQQNWLHILSDNMCNKQWGRIGFPQKVIICERNISIILIKIRTRIFSFVLLWLQKQWIHMNYSTPFSVLFTGSGPYCPAISEILRQGQISCYQTTPKGELCSYFMEWTVDMLSSHRRATRMRHFATFDLRYWLGRYKNLFLMVNTGNISYARATVSILDCCKFVRESFEILWGGK